MSDSPNLSLPYLAAAQAQKHVTMNEALARLDALAAPFALSADLVIPPVAAVDGDTYIVPVGASGEWAGYDGDVAFAVNGGWSFATPKPGWRVWVGDRGGAAIYTGAEWSHELTGAAINGACLSTRVLVGDESLSGAAVTTAIEIPDRAVVVGVTARVITAVTGAGVTGWRLGVAGSDDRYGSGIGLVADSIANGVTGSPVAYYGATPLEITAEGGAFAGGVVQLAIHYFILTPPASA